MQLTPIKTEPVRHGTKLQDVIDHISEFNDGDILAVTSKIISIMQGRTVRVAGTDKTDLIRKEADYYMPEDRHGVMLTIKNNILIPTAGIDASNADGHYILYPENGFQAAADIRAELLKRFHVKHCGVIITDSRSAIMRRGVTGFSLAWAGFKAFHSYIGKADIFGKPLEHTEVNIPDSLAAAAVYSMGEGAECTPMCRISGAKDITYTDDAVTQDEQKYFSIDMRNDIYAPILTKAGWQQKD